MKIILKNTYTNNELRFNNKKELIEYVNNYIAWKIGETNANNKITINDIVSKYLGDYKKI